MVFRLNLLDSQSSQNQSRNKRYWIRWWDSSVIWEDRLRTEDLTEMKTMRKRRSQDIMTRITSLSCSFRLDWISRDYTAELCLCIQSVDTIWYAVLENMRLESGV